MKRSLSLPALLALLAATAAATAQDPIDTMRELAKPDPMHRHLAKRAGRWEATGRFWLDDGTTSEVAGTIESELLHGGLFLESRVRGQLRGEPYEGRSILGYDAAAGEFVEIWFDNLGPGIHRYTGRCEDRACRRMTLTTRFVDPVWGREMVSRIVVTWEDEDTYRHQTWLAHTDGREFPQLDYTARRTR